MGALEEVRENPLSQDILQLRELTVQAARPDVQVVVNGTPMDGNLFTEITAFLSSFVPRATILEQLVEAQDDRIGSLATIIDHLRSEAAELRTELVSLREGDQAARIQALIERVERVAADPDSNVFKGEFRKRPIARASEMTRDERSFAEGPRNAHERHCHKRVTELGEPATEAELFADDAPIEPGDVRDPNHPEHDPHAEALRRLADEEGCEE